VDELKDFKTSKCCINLRYMHKTLHEGLDLLTNLSAICIFLKAAYRDQDSSLKVSNCRSRRIDGIVTPSIDVFVESVH
jgi:hypothetical protein